MITPSDSPSSPSNYAAVPVQGMDIQAPLMDGEITAAFDEANAMGGSGVLYPMGPRIAQARDLLESPQGFAAGGFNVDAGFHGGQGGDAGWPNDVEPDVAGP